MFFFFFTIVSIKIRTWELCIFSRETKRICAYYWKNRLFEAQLMKIMLWPNVTFHSLRFQIVSSILILNPSFICSSILLSSCNFSPWLPVFFIIVHPFLVNEFEGVRHGILRSGDANLFGITVPKVMLYDAFFICLKKTNTIITFPKFQSIW